VTALKKTLILSSPQSGRLEGRTGAIQALLLLAFVLTALLPLGARAQQLSTQDDGTLRGLADMRAAASYAAQAAVGQAQDEVHARLQRVLNCLEGKKGAEYRQAPAMDTPCHDEGAVNEFSEHSLNKLLVQRAIKLAAIAMTLDGFDSLHFTSQAVQAVLIEALRSS